MYLVIVCILRFVFPVEDVWNQNCKSHWNHVDQVIKWIYTLHSQLILLVEEFEVSTVFNSLYAGIHKLIPWMTRYTSLHLCKNLHHLDIGSSTAAVACHWQDTFSAWLLVLPNASIRSVRHVSTIVALSVAEVRLVSGGIRAEGSGFGAPEEITRAYWKESIKTTSEGHLAKHQTIGVGSCYSNILSLQSVYMYPGYPGMPLLLLKNWRNARLWDIITKRSAKHMKPCHGNYRVPVTTEASPIARSSMGWREVSRPWFSWGLNILENLWCVLSSCAECVQAASLCSTSHFFHSCGFSVGWWQERGSKTFGAVVDLRSPRFQEQQLKRDATWLKNLKPLNLGWQS